MRVLQGIWFDGKTSASIPVEVQVDDTGAISVINMNDQSIIMSAPFSALRISSRIGNTPRYIYFPDGEKLETRQHEIIDQWLQQYRPNFWYNLAHKLETHSYFVALTLVLLISFTWVMAVDGLPAASRYVAFHLPAGLMDRAATETLQLLDKTQLNPTKLDEKTQTNLLKYFESAIKENKDLHINVIFRRGGIIGANAFALPDGTVLFTDEIVRLAKNNDELLSVLAHEIGHVKYRHALRSVIQGSVITFGVAMITGDLSAASNLLATLPVVITNMSYSRNFEREADNNSLVFLDANNIERHHFVDLMERLTYHAECSQLLGRSKLKDYYLEKFSHSTSSESSSTSSAEPSEASDKDPDVKLADENNVKEDSDDEIPWLDVEAHREECDKLIADYKAGFFHSKISGYFASHPETDERTKKFKQQPEIIKEHNK